MGKQLAGAPPAARPAPPQATAPRSAWTAKEASSTTKPRPAPLTALSGSGSASTRPEASQQMARQVLGNAQAGGLLSLVTHLRTDNQRLREALVRAQRETEALVAQQEAAAEEGQNAKNLTLGHLLELVRDFGGDGLGGKDFWDDEEEVMSPGSCQVADADTKIFAICSPVTSPTGAQAAKTAAEEKG